MTQERMIEILEQARKLVEKQKESEFIMATLLSITNSTGECMEIYDLLKKVSNMQRLALWEADVHRTKQDILNLLDRAIEKVKNG